MLDIEIRSLGDLFTDPNFAAEGIEAARDMVVHTPGDLAEHLYFIHHGQVRLLQVRSDGDSRLIEILGPGQWFGSAALTERGVHTTQAIAVTDTQLSKVSAARLLEHLGRAPHLATQLIRQLAGHLQNARDAAAQLVFEDCNHRLVGAMLRFSDSAAASRQGDNVVLYLTHEQLAQAVGAARETVSLALTQMRRRNLVHTGRNRLIFNRENLRQFLSPEDAAPERQIA